jgi:alkylation response protein AidB-like acyl-CoA dehydrogenase
MEGKKGFAPEMWKQVSELGWPALIIPEQYGGIGMTVIDLIVVMEEMGRALFPSPFLFNLMGTFALLEAGSEEQKQKYLPLIASGECLTTLAFAEPGDIIDIRGVNSEARKSGDGFALNGEKLFVDYAHAANLMIVPCRTAPGKNPGEGITLFLVDPKEAGVKINVLRAIDLTRKNCQVILENVKLAPDRVLGEVDRGGPVFKKLLLKSTVALAAEMIGGAEAALAKAVDYAKIREQFGRPIGAFQGIKHPLADMYVDIELAKGLVYYAALSLENGLEDAEIAVSSAKTAISDAFTRVGMESILIHGGVGYTWECDAHLFLRRAKWSEYTLGDPGYHREHIAQLMGM